MITLEQYDELRPFINDVKHLILQGDDGTEIAKLVNVPTISPLYEPLVGMLIRYSPSHYAIGVGRKYVGWLRLFFVLHEVFHIKLKHIDLAGFLDKDGIHGDFESFRNPLARYLVVDTEKEANIYTALSVFDDSILERTGCQQLQEIKNVRESLVSLENTLTSLRYRWSLYKDPLILTQIRKSEYEKQSLEETLDSLHFMLEDRHSFESVECIAMEYGVPPACIQCYLEGKRLLGYNAIPVQTIDWLKIFNPEKLKQYEHKECFDAS